MTPITITPITETTVKIIPSEPDLRLSMRFMPKPRPTTEACSRYFETNLLALGQGVPKIMAKIRPAARPAGAVISGLSRPKINS